MNDWDRDSFDFPLTPESVVVELGGYEGRWCSEIARRYQPRLYVYEPQLWAADRCRKALADAGATQAQVFPYGLGTGAGALQMGEYGTDGCSFMPAGRVQGTGEMREWYAEMAERDLSEIDLLLVNIEGYEFTLLPHLYPVMWAIRWLMVQFHVGTERHEQYQQVRRKLAETHRPRLDYGHTLVCWERRS